MSNDFGRVKCGTCGKSIKFPLAKEGRAAKCPGCSEPLQLVATPTPADPAGQAPEAAPARASSDRTAFHAAPSRPAMDFGTDDFGSDDDFGPDADGSGGSAPIDPWPLDPPADEPVASEPVRTPAAPAVPFTPAVSPAAFAPAVEISPHPTRLPLTRSYPMLETIAILLRAAGYLIVGLSVVAFIVGAVLASRAEERETAVAAWFATGGPAAIVAIVAALLLVTLSEMIKLAMHIQENTLAVAHAARRR